LPNWLRSYQEKGSQLYVEGKITTRSWEKVGVTRYTTEIVAENIQLLGAKRTETTPNNQPVQGPKTDQLSSDLSDMENPADDLPF
jgi:single-strand DNA-binding protein